MSSEVQAYGDLRKSDASGAVSGWVRLFFVDGPRELLRAARPELLTRRGRGGEGGGGGLLTGGAIPSAYRWAWCRWYSRVVEVPVLSTEFEDNTNCYK